MKRLVVAVAAVSCLARTEAMPTQAELKKAQPLVVELMAPTMAEFKAAGAKDKATAAVKVADTSTGFVSSAETEAAKFLLLKGAVSFYTRGEAYDKAADAVEALKANVKDVTPAVIAEITGKATGKISETKAPRLFALYRAARLQVRAENEAKTLAQKLKKVKSDALQRRYAEALAVSGDWKAAYGEFAKLSDAKLKAVVEAEANGKAKNAESGEFWWAYEPEFEDAEDIFKIHAAVFYRQALSAGEITGLKKTIVEQRLKQMSDVATPVVISGSKLARIKLPVTVADPIVLIPCPAGSLTVGFNKAHVAFAPRKVTLSRPFWMSEAPITVGQYTALMGSFDVLFEPRFGVKPRDGMHKLYKAMGEKACAISGVNADEIDRYCAKLLAKYKRLIPEGYVVRLPSEAEWMYAFKCGGHVREPNYAALAQGDEASDYGEIGVEFKKTLSKAIQDLGLSFSQDKISEIGFYVPRCRVKTCKPNDWGFYDLAGLCWERLADRASAVHAGSATWNKKGIASFTELNEAFVADEEVDPILITDDKPGQTLSIMCHPKNWGKWVVESQRCWDVGFRLVIGPDLVSEWKAKHGKK